MKVMVSAQETHAGDEPYESEIMVPMQVRDKNMIDSATPDLIFIHLGLRAFPAIDQEKVIVQGDNLGRGMTVEGRDGRIISKYSYREHRQDLGKINQFETFISCYWLKNNTKSNRNRI
jgi:hypothetical protein